MQMKWTFAILVGVVITARSEVDADDKKPPALKPHKPITCEKAETVTLDGVLIETKDVAVTAGTNCKLTITNSKIVSTGNFAVSLGGSSKVTLTGVEVSGKWASITSGAAPT